MAIGLHLEPTPVEPTDAKLLEITPPRHFDAIVIGGGPAGSACATAMQSHGMRVAVLDRASFPRVKLCAGWLSAPVWDVLEIAPERYPGHLWTWDSCHVHFGGADHTIAARGYFIRRYEFDHWLLGKSGATVIVHAVKNIEREGDEWVVDGKFRARYLIGAGGTHCPVARALFPKKPRKPVGAQELEFPERATEIARTRMGKDGEPELLLFSDLSGYAWNVPKGDWLNVGCGSVNPKNVHAAWREAREFFEDRRHLPEDAADKLEFAKGHAYFLFDPQHLEQCARKNAFLVGDALGLAQPLTAEGILPAILSGRICGEAIVDGSPEDYPLRLGAHSIIRDYELLYHLRERGAALRARARKGLATVNARLQADARLWAVPAVVGRLGNAAVARGFAWMFSGRPLGGQLIHPLLRRL